MNNEIYAVFPPLDELESIGRMMCTYQFIAEHIERLASGYSRRPRHTPPYTLSVARDGELLVTRPGGAASSERRDLLTFFARRDHSQHVGPAIRRRDLLLLLWDPDAHPQYPDNFGVFKNVEYWLPLLQQLVDEQVTEMRAR